MPAQLWLFCSLLELMRWVSIVQPVRNRWRNLSVRWRNMPIYQSLQSRMTVCRRSLTGRLFTAWHRKNLPKKQSCFWKREPVLWAAAVVRRRSTSVHLRKHPGLILYRKSAKLTNVCWLLNVRLWKSRWMPDLRLLVRESIRQARRNCRQHFVKVRWIWSWTWLWLRKRRGHLSLMSIWAWMALTRKRWCWSPLRSWHRRRTCRCVLIPAMWILLRQHCVFIRDVPWLTRFLLRRRSLSICSRLHANTVRCLFCCLYRMKVCRRILMKRSGLFIQLWIVH